jgi:cytochrome c oxidase subunit 2
MRNSILNPASQVVEGFQPIMPTFKGQVTEEQLNSLVAYIKSLSPNAATTTAVPAVNKPAANANPPAANKPAAKTAGNGNK